jgi:S-DNA-T family DNA segregation ATPase FtsK/SpoIIIE
MRVQCAFVSDGEVENIINFIKNNNGAARYNNDFIKTMEEEAARCGQKKGGVSIESEPADAPEGGDSKFREAVKLAIETGKISTSLMQRRLGVGYGRAAKIIDTMEQMGYVSAPDGNKPRQVLITMDEYMRRVTEGSLGEMED